MTVVLVATLGACTIIRPVQLPNGGEGAAMIPVVEATPPVGTQICHSRGQQVTVAACSIANRSPQCFAGHLGWVRSKMDQRQQELQRLAAGVVNGNSAYNSLLYLASGGVVYQALNGATSNGLLAATVAMATGYALMNSGIPERSKYFRETADKLACAIDLSLTWEYTLHDLQCDSYVRTGLDLTIANLDQAVKVYRQQSKAMQLRLLPRPGLAAPSLDMLERREYEAHGRRLGGVAGSDSRAAIAERIRLQLESARQILDRTRMLREKIDASGEQLSANWLRIELEFQKIVQERAPAPRSPDKQIVEIRAKMDVLESGLATAEGALLEPSPHDRELCLPSLYAGLDAASQKELRDFCRGDPVQKLEEAQYAAQAWLDAHETRKKWVEAAASRRGCEVPSPAVVQLGSGAKRDNATRPGTSLTGKSQKMTPSETALPSASR